MTERPNPLPRLSGWRVHWQHATSPDRFIGELWPMCADAEYIARSILAAGCRDVRVVRW